MDIYFGWSTCKLMDFHPIRHICRCTSVDHSQIELDLGCVFGSLMYLKSVVESTRGCKICMKFWKIKGDFWKFWRVICKIYPNYWKIIRSFLKFGDLVWWPLFVPSPQWLNGLDLGSFMLKGPAEPNIFDNEAICLRAFLARICYVGISDLVLDYIP